MQFKIDENLPVRLGDFLIREGFKAESIFEEKMSGCSDEKVFKHCKEKNLVFITLDLDFANIHAYPAGKHPGIIVLKLKEQSARAAVKTFKAFLERVGDMNGLIGCTVIVEESRYRVRRG